MNLRALGVGVIFLVALLAPVAFGVFIAEEHITRRCIEHGEFTVADQVYLCLPVTGGMQYPESDPPPRYSPRHEWQVSWESDSILPAIREPERL